MTTVYSSRNASSCSNSINHRHDSRVCGMSCHDRRATGLMPGTPPECDGKQATVSILRDLKMSKHITRVRCVIRDKRRLDVDPRKASSASLPLQPRPYILLDTHASCFIVCITHTKVKSKMMHRVQTTRYHQYIMIWRRPILPSSELDDPPLVQLPPTEQKEPSSRPHVKHPAKKPWQLPCSPSDILELLSASRSPPVDRGRV